MISKMFHAAWSPAWSGVAAAGVLIASAGLVAAGSDPEPSAAIPQPAALVIDPVRDGTVVVLARDGRYLEAAFGGTPWNDLWPRSTYLLSTCVEDRAHEAPIVRRVIDIAGCEVSVRDRWVLAHSAIPTILLRGHSFVFGPIPLAPRAQIDRIAPTHVTRPELAAPRPPMVATALSSLSAFVPHNGLRGLTASATGAGSTVVINGGNAYTFQWGRGAGWVMRTPLPASSAPLAIMGPSPPRVALSSVSEPRAPLIAVGAPPPGLPPSVLKSGVVVAVAIPPLAATDFVPVTGNPGALHSPPAIALPVMHAGTPPTVSIGTLAPPLPPHPPAAAVASITKHAAPPLPKSGMVAAVAMAPRSSWNSSVGGSLPVAVAPGYFPPHLGTGPAPTAPGVSITPWASGAYGAPPATSAVPGGYVSIVPPRMLGPTLSVPTISHAVATRSILGGPPFHGPYGPGFNWIDPVPGRPQLTPGSVRAPVVIAMAYALPSIATPLHLPPIAHPTITAPRGTIASALAPFQQTALTASGQSVIWSPPSQVRNNLYAGGATSSPPAAYAAQGLYASSFHLGRSGAVGSPTIYGPRR